MKLLVTILTLFCHDNCKSCLARLLFCVLVAFAVLGKSSFSVAESAPNWQSVPLHTRAQQIAGVAGGEGFQQIMSIVFAPSDPSRVYLSSDTSQVWRSDDGGYVWRKANTGFLSNGARSLFVHPLNPDIILAAGFLGKEQSRIKPEMNPLQGIFLSIDGANKWRFVQAAAFYKQGTRSSLFAMDSRTKADANFTVYVGTFNDGLLCSTDGGLTWDVTAFKLKQITSVVESVNQPGRMLLATTSGFYTFYDGQIAQLGNGLPSWPRSISASQGAPKTVYAAVGKFGVYKSLDSGQTFVFSGFGLPPIVNWTDVICSNTDADILYVKGHKSSIGPFFSHDGGLSWHKAKNINVDSLAPLEGMYFSSPIAVHPLKPSVALIASNGRATVLRTKDGGLTWRYSGSGYTGGRLMDITFADPITFYFGLTDHGLWKTSDSGQTFEPLPVPKIDGKSVQAADVEGNNLVIGIGQWKRKSLAISHDAGSTWVKFKKFTGSFDCIKVHAGRPGVVYAGKYHSDDYGSSWITLEYEVRAVFQPDNDVIYSIRGEGDRTYVMVSRDLGQTWHSPYSPLSVPEKSIHAIAVHPKQADEICIATSVGIFILRENEWRKRNHLNGLALDHFGGCYIQTLAFDDDDPRIIYAGRRSPGRGVSNGIFRSKDSGETWHAYNGNLGNYFNVWSIHCSPFDDTVYIGTSHGTYKTHAFH